MEQKRSYKLVEGNFNCAEATEVLFSLINSKIKFHDLQSFGKKERSEVDTHHSDKRSRELKTVLEEIRGLIAEAEKEGADLHISGNIHIRFIHKKKHG